MPIREWLSDIANRVIHEAQREYARPNDGLIHAGMHDFEEAFEIPLQIYREQIRCELQEEYNLKMNSIVKEMPNFGVEAMKTRSRIRDLYLELARRDNHDVR